MSAYVVDDTTINRILAYLWRRDTSLAQNMTSAYAADALDGEPGSLSGLGQALRDLNVAAVSARYPDTAPDDLPGPCPLLPYVFAEEAEPTPVAAYKALSCLLYQCSEGDIPESPLYRALEDCRARVASKVISRLPEYDRAPWG